MSVEVIKKYFPNITEDQANKYKSLESIYKDWNAKINVISRKDIDELYIRHVLHSLAIAKVQIFHSGARVLDVGTGGGFPGIPLAIMFPETNFHLVDAIGKKIKVVHEVAEALGLKNVKAEHTRVEKAKGTFDFIVSRAVTNMPEFVKLVRNRIAKDQKHELKNGILYLKGGDLTNELSTYTTTKVYNVSDYFEEDFFETKKVVYLPIKYKGK
jgi:16S rRNA (guanine527-N7)-methyltransferase